MADEFSNVLTPTFTKKDLIKEILKKQDKLSENGELFVFLDEKTLKTLKKTLLIKKLIKIICHLSIFFCLVRF